MRRIIIIIMLTTICYSSLHSIIPMIPKTNPHMLLDTVYGGVTAGNFTYWTFAQIGPLLIELTSLKGDADLFVGDSPRPSFEADKNNFSSETCGVDRVRVPEDFPRPIGIGVFGHWAHSRSEFIMKVYMDFESMKTTYSYAAISRALASKADGEKRPSEADFNRKNSLTDEPKLSESEPRRREVVTRKEEERPRFLKLFRVLDTVFDLFVL